MSTSQTSPTRAGQVEWGEEPLRYLIRVILRFLRTVFSTAPKHLYFFSDNDPDASRVMITGDLPVLAESVHVRPHIVPFFSGIQWQGMSLDQLQSEDFLGANREHTDLITGNLSISVLSANANESLFIAFHIANFLWVLRRLLMKTAFHDIGQRLFISPPTEPGRLVSNDLEGELISVTVTSPFSFKWDVRVQEQGHHLLKMIEGELETTREPAVGQAGMPVDMIGTAVSTVNGQKPMRTYSARRSLYPDITDRRTNEVSTALDYEPIVQSFKVEETEE